MLPSVARSARPRFGRPGPKNSTNLQTTPRSRSISVTRRTRSVAVAPSRSSPSSLKPITCGSSIEIGWPSIAASASIPPTPQPRTLRPLIIVVWESVPTSVSGYALAVRPLLVGPDDPAEVLEVDLVADAGRGRDDAEVVERLLAPAQELVALLVALELALGVDLEGAGVAEGVDLDRVVDHEVDRDERVDLGGVGAELLDRVAHRGQIDDGRHAGEVLHQDPGGLEGDLLRRLGLRVPGGDGLDVVGRDALAVLEPEDVLQQDLQRVGQPSDVELRLQRVEAVDLVLAPANLQAGLRAEAVCHPYSFSAPVSGRPVRDRRPRPRRRALGQLHRIRRRLPTWRPPR